MLNDTSLHAVTANDLRNGDIVFLANVGGWTHSLSQAAVATSADDAGRLLGVARAHEGLVAEPYLIAVEREADGGLTPVHSSERIRTLSPSSYHDLGHIAVCPSAVN
ncbi:MAG: DUF2849 domain-containing protein [Alphaproteobacteria bacterium]